MSRPTVAWYTVYLAATDEIAACGTAEDCVRARGLSSVPVFRSIVSHTRHMQRDPALAAGVVDYINPVMQSNGKALSQNANWAAANGLPLTKRQQAMMDAVDKLAKPIGQETTLYRADHDDFLKRLKVNNYQSMSDSQLRKALVGKTWTNDCLESTAYDSRDNPF